MLPRANHELASRSPFCIKLWMRGVTKSKEDGNHRSKAPETRLDTISSPSLANADPRNAGEEPRSFYPKPQSTRRYRLTIANRDTGHQRWGLEKEEQWTPWRTRSKGASEVDLGYLPRSKAEPESRIRREMPLKTGWRHRPNSHADGQSGE